MASSDFPYTINVDWLQIFCHDKNFGLLNEIYYEKSAYEFVKMEYSSRHFREIWEVRTIDGEKYATIQRRPFSSVISTDGAIIQLANRELYKPCFVSEFLIFINSHGFKCKSISRLDVCFDSNHLLNNLQYPSFIRKIIEKKYLKNNQSKIAGQFSAEGTLNVNTDWNSLRWGSPRSGVSTKVYNKTLEMKEVKQKPYITECWMYNGIDITQDVWRMEISIKSDASTTIRTETGEIFRLTPDSLGMQSVVEDVFFSYAKKYFAFKRNDGKQNKSRMKDVEIFPRGRKSTLHPVRITEKQDSSRSDRIFIKKLHTLFTSLPNIDTETWSAIWEVSNAFTISRSLCEWRKKNVVFETETDLDLRTYEDNVLFRIRTLFKELSSLYPDEAENIETLQKKLLLTINTTES